jgi:hypothetical protein
LNNTLKRFQELTHPHIWGQKTTDFRELLDGENDHPAHINFKVNLTQFYKKTVNSQKIYGYDRPRTIPQYLINDHQNATKTLYFTANSWLVGKYGRYIRSGLQKVETFLLIDIDCHHCGTLKAALAYAESLKERWFPNLYYEVSTNGNGVHGYLILERTSWKDEEYNKLCDKFDKWLKNDLASGNLDVELVEIKGTSSIIAEDGTVLNMGVPAKLPRGEAAVNTTTMMGIELEQLIDNNPNEIVDETKVEKLKKMNNNGSIKCITADDLPAWRKIAKKLLPCGYVQLPHDRGRMTVEDLAIFLSMFYQFDEKSNPDQSMPTLRFEVNHKAWKAAGYTTRSWDGHRFTFTRNYATKLGFIDIIDECYKPPIKDAEGNIIKKGKAMEWCASELMHQVWEKQQETPNVKILVLEGNFSNENIKEPINNNIIVITMLNLTFKPVKMYQVIKDIWSRVDELDQIIQPYGAAA